MEITLNLPEQVYQGLSTAAHKARRQVADLIVEVVAEKYTTPPDSRPLAASSDAEVLALARLQMPKRQSDRHSQLLYKNQAGTLKPAEQRELDFFQQIYGVALLKKADGLYEATQRNLIKSPDDLACE
jgi:hypothetical protein